jgi:hypothetical protein
VTGTRKVRFHPTPASLLPSDKAFVVQLVRATDPELRVFSGRVEHLASGRRRRFETVGQFLEQVARLLAEGREPGHGSERAGQFREDD